MFFILPNVLINVSTKKGYSASMLIPKYQVLASTFIWCSKKKANMIQFHQQQLSQFWTSIYDFFYMLSWCSKVVSNWKLCCTGWFWYIQWYYTGNIPELVGHASQVTIMLVWLCLMKNNQAVRMRTRYGALIQSS